MKFIVSFLCISPEPTGPAVTKEVEVEAPTFAIAAQRGEQLIRAEGDWQNVTFDGHWRNHDDND